MFRKTVLLAALALPLAAAAFAVGPARAEGEATESNIAQTLSPAESAPTQHSLSSRPVVVAGMERLTVEHGSATQSLATGGAPRLTTTGDGEWHTAYGPTSAR